MSVRLFPFHLHISKGFFFSTGPLELLGVREGCGRVIKIFLSSSPKVVCVRQILIGFSLEDINKNNSRGGRRVVCALTAVARAPNNR